MTSLGNLPEATTAYSHRMGIEEMFRDLKKGGYNLESTGLRNERLLSLVLLITLAYVEATFQGDTIQQKGVTNYIGRTKEDERSTRRHSRFYIGLHGKEWLDSMQNFASEYVLLRSLSPHKRKDYEKGLRAATIASSAF